MVECLAEKVVKSSFLVPASSPAVLSYITDNWKQQQQGIGGAPQMTGGLLVYAVTKRHPNGAAAAAAATVPTDWFACTISAVR